MKTPRDKTYFSFGRSSPESIRDSWYFNPKQSVFLNAVKQGLTNKQLANKFKTEEHVIEKHIRKLKDQGVLEDFKKLRPNLVKKYKDALKKVKRWAKNPTFENWNKFFGPSVPYQQVNKDIGRNIRAYFTGEKITRKGSSTIGGEESTRILNSLNIKKEIPKNAQNVLKTFTKDFFTSRRADIGRKVSTENKLEKSFQKVIDINKQFKKDPSISLIDLTKALNKSEFAKGDDATKLRLATTVSDDVAKYLQALNKARKVPKGMSSQWSPPTGEKLNEIVDRIASQTGDFRFQEGTLRKYKFSIRDALLNLRPNTTENLRRVLSGTPGVIDEVVGLSATYQRAPGYTEFMQLIPDEVNRQKNFLLDRRFGPVLENALQGDFEGVDEFNKASKAFAKKYNIDTPLINPGGDPKKDILYFDQMSKEAQKNVLDLADKGKGFTIKTTTLPLKPMTERFQAVSQDPILYNKLVDAVDNAPQVCRKILNYQTGGISQTCANALREDPVGAAEKLKNLDAQSGPLAKVKNAAVSFLKSGGFKTFGAAGVAGALGSAIVKEFRNDDPTTYLSNEAQQKNMLVAMATDPITTELPRPDILDYQLPLAGALAAGSIAATAPKTIEASRSNLKFASRSPGVEKKKPGIIKTGFRTLGRGLGVAASPGLLAPLAAMDITRQVSEGDSPVDIATDPLNYLYPAFADQTPRLTRGLSPTVRKVARLGLSRAALTGLSRLGIGGFAASLGIQGLGLLDD